MGGHDLGRKQTGAVGNRQEDFMQGWYLFTGAVRHGRVR
jgi:hypothetical protein